MKPPTQFTGHHLKGLWHKHVLRTDLKGFATNVKHALGKNEMNRLAERLIVEQGKKPIQQLAAELANDAVNTYWVRKENQKLTGNWLIYAVHEGKNYYLAVCDHEEQDEQIAKNIMTALKHEFPLVYASHTQNL